MADRTAHPTLTAPPLVGRDREQATLRDALVTALAGRGSLVLIGGEAGIGKTTLAETLLAEAASQGALVLIGRCYDLSETPPYGPWAEALASAPRDTATPPDLAGGTSDSQAALFASVRDYLAVAIMRHPLFLLLDDLHWADPASLDLLRALGRHLAHLPVLLLATYRDDEVGPDHPLYPLIPLLVREARARRLDLRPLGEAAILTLVNQNYPLAPDDTARLVPYLAERAEGNPFFLSELLRALEEARTLQPAGSGWTLAPLDQLPVPRLLRQVIDSRLAHLSIATREALAAAAVIGQIVPFSLWAALTSRDEPALLETATEVAAARLVDELADGTGVRFVHALTREAVYEGIRPAHRRTLHQQAAESLLTAANPDPDAVASHLIRAGDPRAAEWLRRAGDRAHRAYAWLTAAARYEAALTLSGPDEIAPLERAWLLFRLAQLRRFADALGALPNVEEAVRLAEQYGDRFLAARARLSAGQLRCIAGDYLHGMREMEAGLTALEALTETERARQDQLDPTDRSAGRGTYVAFLAILGRYAEARAIGEPYVAAAPNPEVTRRLGAAPHADAQTGLGMVYAALGQPDKARQMFAQARAALRAVDHPLMVGLAAALELTWVSLPFRAERREERRAIASEGTASGLFALMGWSDNLSSMWQLALMVAEGHWTRVIATAKATGANSLVMIWQAALLAQVAFDKGDATPARQLLRRWLPDGPATEPGSVEFLEASRFQRLAAALEVNAGNLPAARIWLEAHDRWLAWNGTLLGRAERQLGWAAYHRAAANPTQARECAREALASASEPRQPLALLAAHRALGEFDTSEGHYAEAIGHLDIALALAEDCCVPYERALCLLALAELRAAEAQWEDATRALTEAYAIFADLGAAPALARAKTLAAQISASSVVQAQLPILPTSFPGKLSRRETEVLRLLAAGRSNREIAAALFLSPRTVQRHIANAYLKIGAHNKAEATAYALRHNLI
jgi:DNA-binding CsgD family transcriptional regulator